MRRTQIMAQVRTMARTVNVAVRVGWLIEPCRPVLATAKVVAWTRLSAESYVPCVKIPEHGLHHGEGGLSNLPKGLAKKIQASGVSFHGGSYHTEVGDALSKLDVSGAEFEFPVLIYKRRARNDQLIEGDPILARNAFLALPQTISALSEFLNTYGVWSQESTYGVYLERTNQASPKANVSIVYPERIWNQQRWLREALRSGTARWISQNQKLFITSRERFPHFVHGDSTCFEAIVNSVTVDFMRGVRLVPCQRTDCHNIFEDSHKGKKFCSQYCGHLTSVRRSRAGAGKNAAPKKRTNGAI
jgi:hypothetical protein